MSDNLRKMAIKKIQDNPFLAEEIFKVIWKQHVKDDALTRISDVFDSAIEEDMRDEVADNAAELYVFEGKYECNRDYWSNLDALISQY